jgi:hypothetical protein
VILDRLRISQRLSVSFGAVLALVLLASLVALWCIRSAAGDAATMMSDPLVKERLAHEWFRNITAGVKRTTAIAKSSDTSLDAVFAEDELDAGVQAFLAPMLARTPRVLRACKANAIAARRGLPYDERRGIEADGLVRTWTHDDHWAAVDRVLAPKKEKR